MIEEVVPSAMVGERVDRAVTMITGCSRRAAALLVDAGAVRVNGRVTAKPSERLDEGDVVTVDEDALPDDRPPDPDVSIEVDVVHEDDDLVVVHKPAGLVVHPGSGTPAGTLVNGLLARYPDIAGVGEPDRPGIVHRLDKGTSGLLVVARTEQARRSLGDQLAARSVERRYVALVWGHPDSDSGVIDAAIGRSRRRPTRMAVTVDGRSARTHYTVLRRAVEPAEVAELECRLETGRTHQIRVHCSAIGHPVVGDDLYGGRRQSLPFDRPALHAASLGFNHPRTGEWLRFDADPPADLADLLASLASLA